ncbi:hypothetical protein FEM48_Zijuj12G0185000 [Ziziphus jujuba var. spinosa]|uniref:Disease resistance protein RPP13-like n=1 Tax=Ziziphus jujuba var. spinosa TaxID=714518 RepID=A0A978UEV2_ZIZJJ|nr:hypothetical protein FEM48_Zijuj12G0185000 [Ziziphus jujuba var. spinosa]
MADIIVPIVLKNLIKVVKYEANLLSGVEGQVSLLERDLQFMNAFLETSAGKRDEHHLVQELVDQIRDVALKSEDVIDTYMARIIKQRRTNLMLKLFHCIGHSSGLHHVADEISRIDDEIKKIYENKSTFGIDGSCSNVDEMAEQELHRRRRNVEEDDVVGFANDTTTLVKLLTDQGNMDLEVVSIIGMGGLGKTTLARKIYNNTLVKDRFKDCCAWVDVSQGSQTKSVLLDILNCFMTVSDETSQKPVEELKDELGKCLKEKRYFVVLDDIWDTQVWEELGTFKQEGLSRTRMSLQFGNRWKRTCRKLGKFEKLPSSIFKLGHLETIHLDSKVYNQLPKGIWMMKRLRHLHVSKFTKLPDLPSSMGSPFSNLQVLSGLLVQRNTALVIAKCPNIRKLRLMLVYNNNEEPRLRETEMENAMKNIGKLEYLESFKFESVYKGSHEKIRISLGLEPLLPSKLLTKISLTYPSFGLDHFKVLAKHPSICVLKITSWDDYEQDVAAYDINVVREEIWCITTLQLVEVSNISYDLKNMLEQLQENSRCKISVKCWGKGKSEMVDGTVGFLAENFTRLLTDEVKLLRGVERQVRSLQNELKIINIFLKISEEKRIKSDILKEVVNQIRDAAHEADDVIDMYIVEVIKQRRRNFIGRFVHSFDHAKMLHHVASNITNIKNIIREIYNNRYMYGIEEEAETSGEAEQAYQLLERRRRYVEEDDVVGYVDDTETLVKKLIEEQIYEMPDEELKRTLCENLKGKRYLLVMDDIWKTQVWDEIKDSFPNELTGSRILITSRIKEVAMYASKNDPHFLRLLNENESWELFCKKVFRGESCPSNLEELGKQIVRCCKGLPLSIIVLGGILALKEKSYFTWSKWLCRDNLIQDKTQCAQQKFLVVHSNPKHSLTNKPRRVSILCETSQFLSLDHWDPSCARSLLLFNSQLNFDTNHWRWIYKGFKLIRALYLKKLVSSIPKQLGKLIHLRYLMIDGDKYDRLNAIPASICKLPFLQTIDIKFCVINWLPKDIWRMKQLRHLKISKGIRLPVPRITMYESTLSNLQVLSRLVVTSQTVSLVTKCRFPNVRKLHLGHADNNLSEDKQKALLASLEKLQSLETLKISGFRIVQPHFDIFPSSPTKISIDQCYLDRDHMRMLGRLTNLRVLKITMAGPMSISCISGEFPQLEVFQMVHVDIPVWAMESGSMPNLQRLVIKGCKDLRYLPQELCCITTLRLVEVSQVSAELITSIRKLNLNTACKLLITTTSI